MIKVLNSINSEISNIDDAFLYKTVFGGKSGILAGRLNDCNIFQSSSNILTIDTGELLIYGVRVLIDEPIHFTLSNTPYETIEYELIIEVQLLANKSILCDIRYQIPNNLVKQSLYTKNTGIYQFKLAKFTHMPDGSIEQLKIIVPKLYGGNTGLQVGSVTSAITDKALSVKIENVYNANKLLEEVNFDFKIPKGDQGKNGKSIRFRGEYKQMPEEGLAPDDDPLDYTYYNDVDYLDIVTYQGSVYVPKVGMIAGQLPTNVDYWDILVDNSILKENISELEGKLKDLNKFVAYFPKIKDMVDRMRLFEDEIIFTTSVNLIEPDNIKVRCIDCYIEDSNNYGAIIAETDGNYVLINNYYLTYKPIEKEGYKFSHFIISNNKGSYISRTFNNADKTGREIAFVFDSTIRAIYVPISETSTYTPNCFFDNYTTILNPKSVGDGDYKHAMLYGFDINNDYAFIETGLLYSFDDSIGFGNLDNFILGKVSRMKSSTAFSFNKQYRNMNSVFYNYQINTNMHLRPYLRCTNKATGEEERYYADSVTHMLLGGAEQYVRGQSLLSTEAITLNLIDNDCIDNEEVNLNEIQNK